MKLLHPFWYGLSMLACVVGLFCNILDGNRQGYLWAISAFFAYLTLFIKSLGDHS